MLLIPWKERGDMKLNSSFLIQTIDDTVPDFR